MPAPYCRHPDSPYPDLWTIADLQNELERFESEAKRPGATTTSVRTYLGRSRTFVRWLGGDYKFQGPRL